MIRYEILSNVASTDTGLQHFPALQDLADTLDAHGIEARFVRQTFRAEQEINLASSKHARGVRVRSTAVRQVSPESHLKGCLAWLRAVVSRVERGLHLHVEKVRATNGATLILAQIYARRQRVFLSGLADDAWLRLTARADLSGRSVPEQIASAPALREEYLSRATRPTGFLASMQRVAALKLVAPEFQALLAELVAARDPARFKALSEAQIINLGLIEEGLERYEKLVQQLVELLASEAVLGDLPPLFDLLTQGIAFPLLRETLAPFALEEKRERITDRRRLVAELRIGLQRDDGVQRERCLAVLLPLVLRMRLRQDADLIAHAVRLPPGDRAQVEALAPVRQQFAAWEQAWRSAAGKEANDGKPVPLPVAQGLLELAVNLVFQARFAHKFPEGGQPPPVVLARNLLSCFVFDRFDITRLRHLHPGLPPSGVARNLAGRINMTGREVNTIRGHLRGNLFPLGDLAAALAGSLRARLEEQAHQLKVRERERFMTGSHVMLSHTNYVLGSSGRRPVLRRGALAAGRALGLVVLESRDQIRHRASLERLGVTGEQQAEGYQLLMNRDDSRFFPLAADPRHLARAYRYLYGARVVQVTHRLLANKLNYLYQRYGDGLFDVLYDRVVWEHQLRLSREQLGGLLAQAGVFDKARLRQFGFPPASAQQAEEHENPWLRAALAAPAEDPAPLFGSAAVEQACQAAEDAFGTLLKRYAGRRTPAGEGRPSLLETLARLAGEGVYDLKALPARQALSATAEARRLGAALAELVSRQPEAFVGGGEDDDAVELTLAGPLAYLALLQEGHVVTLEERVVRVRLRPGRHLEARQLAGPSLALANQLSELLGRNGPAAGLRGALETLQRHDVAWRRLTQAAAPALIDQMLRETVLRLIQPQPPAPEGLAQIPEERVLCLATSSFDQSRFHRVVAHPERREVYATLSELASWLLRFARLREELEDYRGLIADILDLIASFNRSAFDAPQLNRYAQALESLSTALDVRPEDITREELAAIERQAAELGRLIRDIFGRERTLRLRDRWLSRVAMRLRLMRPNVRLTFVDRLHELNSPAAPPEEGEEEEEASEVAAREEEYQTFSERVRNAIEFRERLAGKDVFVMSPSNNQRQLTLMLVDELHRLKGVHTPLFADVSGCESFVDQLRTRIPPYRLFDLNAL